MNTIRLNDLEMHLCGDLLKDGVKMPECKLVNNELRDVCLCEFKGKRVVLNVFPSLDTEICARSVRRFNEEVSKLPNTVVLCISKDLPFAASRFCAANGIDNVVALSGFRSDFGNLCGVEIADGPMKGLYARVLIVLDEEGKVIKTILNDQIAEEPNYQAAFDCLA